MVLGFVFFSIFGAFLALGVALVLATFETPWVYKFLGVRVRVAMKVVVSWWWRW